MQHLGDRPRSHLHKYEVPRHHVRGAIAVTDQKFSYHPKGFYMTLKKRVLHAPEILSVIDDIPDLSDFVNALYN